MSNLHRTMLSLPETLWQRVADIAHEENKARMNIPASERPAVTSACKVFIEAATGKRAPIVEQLFGEAPVEVER